MRPKTYSKDKIPVFIEKLYKILEDQHNKSVIEWTDWGDSFIILNLKAFTEEILPQYFKHSNYHSFIRQLNMYSFTKIRHDQKYGYADHLYQNSLFLKNNPSKLRDIRRKQIVTKTQQPLIPYNGLPEQQQQDSLQEKLNSMKIKHEKLTQVCYGLINQNKILVEKNQELIKLIKKQAKKKDRILNQIFRIIGSISEQWEEFIGENHLFIEDVTNEKKLYIDMLMNFIDQNEMPTILSTLKKFLNLGDIKKSKNFTIIPPQSAEEEEMMMEKLNNPDNLESLQNLDNPFLDQDIDQFFNQASLILDKGE